MDRVEQEIPARANGADAISSDGNKSTYIDYSGARISRLAILALAFSGLTSVLGYGLIALPNHPVTILQGADIAVLVALLALPLYLAVVSARCGAAALASRFTSRSDSEHEQAILRVVLVAIILCYLFAVSFFGAGQPDLPQAIAIMSAGLIISWLIFVDIWHRPKTSIPRRIVANHADLVILSLVLHVSPAVMAPCYLIYLWVTFGNGFRYGVAFLAVSAVISVVGFGLVIASTQFWQDQLPLSIGLLIALAVLPAYVSTLLRRLRQAINEAEAANRAKSRFFAVTSHELRTPLNAIIGMGDLLRETPLNAEQYDMARTIRTAARSLLAQVNEILDFSKIEAGRIEIAHEKFDLYAVIAGVDSILKPQAQAKDLQLSFNVSPAVLPDFVGDGDHLQEILINLVANAIKFTERGYVKVAVTEVDNTGAQQALRFVVEDSGIGIAPAHLASIFESYTQADNTVTRRFGGTGLGLAITRQLVEHMGGTINVESELDKGSCFSFELSLQVDAVDETDIAAFVEFEPQQVFVLTSDIGTLPNIENALSGWQVDFAWHSAVEVVVEKLALDLASGAARSVIVLDTQLPDAATAIRRIRDETGDREPAILYITSPESPPDQNLPIPLVELEASADAETLYRAMRLAGTFVGQAENLSDDDDRLDGRSTARDLSVLLVEDNPVNRKVINKIMSRAGHRVVTVNDGDAALDVLDAQKFDVILMDVNIPGLSGPETTKHYRFAHLGEDHVPIIALTADATVETRQQCLDAGMDTVVTKPVEARVLIDVVETFALRYGAQPGFDKDSEASNRASVAKPAAASTSALSKSGASADSPPQLRVVSDSPINPTAIANLRELGDDEFVESVIADFLIDAKAIMKSLHQAVDSGQLNSLREHSHALRSSSAHVGATRMHVVAKEIHDLEPVNLDSEGRAMVAALDAEFQILRRALEEELATMSAGGRS